MKILKIMVFPVSLPCTGLVYSIEVLGGVGGEQLFNVSCIFSKEQIEYLSRKSFEELQFFSRKPWEITLDPGLVVLWILGCSLLAIFEFELASPFCLGFKFSPADPGEKNRTGKISARIDNAWLSSGFGEATNKCTTHFSEVVFLHQGGVACHCQGRKRWCSCTCFLLIKGCQLSPLNFCEGEVFSPATNWTVGSSGAWKLCGKPPAGD